MVKPALQRDVPLITFLKILWKKSYFFYIVISSATGILNVVFHTVSNKITPLAFSMNFEQREIT